MKKVLTIFFVTLGVIFFLLIIAGAYFYITDPYNLKPLFFGSTTDESAITDTSRAGTETDKNPALNAEQEAALEIVGIDPATVPTSISPAQEACFVELFGSARVEEIKAGDSPSAIELFQGRSCLE